MAVTLCVLGMTMRKLCSYRAWQAGNTVVLSVRPPVFTGRADFAIMLGTLKVSG